MPYRLSFSPPAVAGRCRSRAWPKEPRNCRPGERAMGDPNDLRNGWIEDWGLSMSWRLNFIWPIFFASEGHCQTLSDSSNSGNQWKSHDGLNLCQVLCSQTKACKAQVPFKAWGSGCLLERWWVFLSEWHQKWHQKWKKSGNLPGLVYTQNQLSHPQTTNSMRICLPTHGEIA